MADPTWKDRSAPGAIGWGRMVSTILARAGVPATALPALIEAIWESHVDHNLWSLVPDGFSASLQKLRRAGVKTAIVSNSEGMLDRLFEKLGIAGDFDAVIDSGKVGVEKPDPRIFQIAAERTGTKLGRALHLGDMVSTDVMGAKAAGMRCALVDPYGHWEGMYPEVPRVAGVVEVARAIVDARR